MRSKDSCPVWGGGAGKVPRNGNSPSPSSTSRSVLRERDRCKAAPLPGIERVWKLTRKLCIHDVYFPNLEAVTTAVEAQFAQWAQGNETLRRLCSI
jgi:hypothetical protein